MANTRELRRRIKSVKGTAQITKAMQMVAATKMRKAQNQALSGRPYNFNLSKALKKVLPLVEIRSHSLLLGNGVKTIGVALLTTDKSLCGALNTNLFRLITASGFLSADAVFYTIGKKGRNFIARSGKNLQADFENLDVVTFKGAVQLAKLVMDAFLAKEVGEVYIVYPRFNSTLKQEPVKIKLLPIEYSKLEEMIAREVQSDSKEDKETESEFLFEPDPYKLLDYILVHYIQIEIYQSLLETKASEHSARMIAMKNATDNALDLVDDLNLAYNQTRQDSITKELLEITTAIVAMS
ncbi:ATP synthase F1 subunit gamma [Patescibacteria group bacterium]|nr:ATP synthase F1 subunit gamma [Patescibacteria group bacterium]